DYLIDTFNEISPDILSRISSEKLMDACAIFAAAGQVEYLYLEQGDDTSGKTSTLLVPIEFRIKEVDEIKIPVLVKVSDGDKKKNVETKGNPFICGYVDEEEPRRKKYVFLLSGVINGTSGKKVTIGHDDLFCVHDTFDGKDNGKMVVDVFDEIKVGDEFNLITLREIFAEAGIEYVDERGRVLEAGIVTCEHGESRVLSLDDYINLENSYEIEVIRKEYKAPKQKPSDKPKRYGILYRIYAEAFYKYVKLLYGPEAEQLYRELAAHDLEKHGGRLGVGTSLSCCEECKNYSERIDQAQNEYRERKEILSFRPQSFRRAEENENIKYSIGTISEAELVEIRDTLEDLGFDVEKMSANEEDFKVVLEKFIQDMLSDNVISFDDYAKYLKVDLTEYIPTASEIVDKNFVSFVDKKGKAINDCYLDELVEKVDIELSEPENIVKDKAYAINIDKKTTGYLYKYKAPNTGNYSIVSFNNGEVDPYLELYTVKNGELVEGTYVRDNDSLYNKNGIISKKLNRGEEIYIKCSINGEGTGNYSISVIDDKGKKPIIGDNYSSIKLSKGEYYLYNDLQKSGSIVIEGSDVKLNLNGKKIDVTSDTYVFDVITSKLQLSNGLVINRGNKKGIVLLERLSQLEILDGYYNGEIDEKSNQVMPITNGKVNFNEAINVNSLIIKGGYFTSAKLKDYVGSGVKSKPGTYTNNGNTYTYKMIPYRAITENDFGKTLPEGEYYLDKDITSGNSSIFISGDVSIDLKGKTLRGTRTWYSTIEVKSGTLNIKNGTIVSDYGYDICVCRGAKLNIESGNYYATGNYDSVWGGNDGAGKIMVNGGTFTKMPSKYEVKKGYDIVESQTKINNLVMKYKLDKAEYIKDIKIGGNGQSFSGYTKINVSLNKGTKGENIYLWYSITDNKNEAIKDIKLTFNESGATTQNLSGYTKLNYNLNNKAGGDNIYLWYTKNGSKPVRKLAVESFAKASENKSNWNTAKGNRNYKYTYTKTEYKNETRTRTVAVTKYRTERRTVWRTVQKVVWKKVKSFFGFFKALFTWKWKQYIEYVREPVTQYVQVPYKEYKTETYVVKVPVTKTYTETRTDNTNYGDLNKKAGGDYIYLRYQY
ncbi:MAG: hypothetical protein IJ593_08885, partial [Lachnospiraceae bacterium]|nr:hypothetical protein [Lachnospiraceae bacterium]